MGYLGRHTRTLVAFGIVTLIACALGQPLKAEPLYGLSSGGGIFNFDSDSPSQASVRTISGLQPAESIIGIDFRPENGQLYAVGDSSRLYIINLNTGVAAQVGQGQFSTAVQGNSFGVDFDPVSDTLRIVSNTGQNLTIDPDNGEISAVDTALSYEASDPNSGSTPTVSALAHTNNFDNASSTTVFVVDTSLDNLANLGSTFGTPMSPESGVLFSLGPVGIGTQGEVGFDISPSSGIGYLAVQGPSVTTSELYGMRFGTGLPSYRLGEFTPPVIVRDIAAPNLDTSSPELSIERPNRDRIRIRRRARTFRGTASDNLQVSEIMYRTVRNGRASSFQSASGTSDWNFRVRNLRRGRTIVQVKALDTFGNESGLDQVVVRRIR